VCAEVQDVQKNPSLRSRPEVIKNIANKRPAPLNMAIAPSVSTSGQVTDARDGTLAIVARSELCEDFDLVAIITSVI
jgi:hypothetical protein